MKRKLETYPGFLNHMLDNGCSNEISNKV